MTANANAPDRLTARPAGAPIAISRDLWGIFFEDISYSADGGLASDLVQNGAFEYSHADRREWSNYTAWRKETHDGGHAAFAVRDRGGLAGENPHYAVIEIAEPDADLINTGFDGMRFEHGASYRLSLWTRVDVGGPIPIEAALLGHDGEAIGEARIEASGDAWTRHEAVITATADETHGSLRLRFRAAGTVAVDFVSLESTVTWHGLPQLAHLRPDLVQALADLHPRFMRFPGGCIVHGVGMDNMYHWKHTIGPVEHRRHNFNAWGYHQSYRLGYVEYLNLCEAIGARPLPILPAGVTCQNTSQGAVPVADEDMPGFIRDVLDLIEFCNGDAAATVWGARRAELGHPEPYGLDRIGIGNEDAIDDVFRDRFRRIAEAVHGAYPDIRIVGTAGPFPDGRDYEEGWEFARRMRIPVVDEHAYRGPSWWFRHLDRYDDYDRNGPHVYLGEYGSWGTKLINALSEAAIMAAMERNGDVVDMASYAPLFCRNGHDSWNPNLIYFDNERVYRTPSYWVQRMFATTSGDHALPVAVEGPVTRVAGLPDRVDLRLFGWGAADVTDIAVTLPDGTRVAAPDVHLDGKRNVDECARLGLAADAYAVDLTVAFRGDAHIRVRFGDVDGPDSSEVLLGRGQAICLVRDGSGCDLATTEESPNAIEAGTVWRIHVDVADRGRSVRLLRDGSLLLEGRETLEEPRRVVTAALAGTAGDGRPARAIVRCVNATEDPCDVDLSALLARLGLAADPTARATVLAGDDPHAGEPGEESPVAPAESEIHLDGGAYHAPAWSFTVLELPVA